MKLRLAPAHIGRDLKLSYLLQNNDLESSAHAEQSAMQIENNISIVQLTP